jgi:putative ABC transport system permease protein
VTDVWGDDRPTRRQVGSQTRGIVWGLPLQALVGIAAAGLALVLVSSQRPARRAVAVAPVEALRIDG